MVDEPGKQGTPEQPLQRSGLICQNCGVTVSPGYPKCPKCHGAMPHVSSPLTQQTPAMSGGTSAVPGSGGFWIALLAIAIAGAVIFFMLRRDAGEPDKEETAVAGDAGGAFDMDAAPEQLVEDDTLGDDAGEEALTPEEALDALEQTLSEQRFYSGVAADIEDETLVRIESAHCDDAAMRGTVDAAADDLAVAGFARVECYSRHGTRSFEIDLLQKDDE